ncbi:MAG: sugar transferase [Rhodobacteraceae bacterium]|nr:sugar transferase [Paracoccaceae bacterium]
MRDLAEGFEYPSRHRRWPWRAPLGKVIYDRCVSLVILIGILPFLAVLCVAIRISSPGPIFFRHTRVGLAGRRFDCIKFRTMVADAELRLDDLIRDDPAARAAWHRYRKLDPDPRVTQLGAFLRRTSLDELPQFWNVLRGDMSIVGPRPISPQEARLYASHFAAYCSVRPGITGVWQVNGRSDTCYDRRVEMDMAYIRERTFWMDLRLTLRTVPAVLAGAGAR